MSEFHWDKFLADHRAVHGCEGMCIDVVTDPTYLRHRRQEFLAGKLPADLVATLWAVAKERTPRNPELVRAQEAARYIVTGQPEPGMLQA